MPDGDLYLLADADDSSGDLYLLATGGLSAFGERMYELLSPLARHDASNGQLLHILCDVFSTGEDAMWAFVEHPGAAEFLAPAVAPVDWLPWCARIVGARVTPEMSESQQRLEVEHPSGPERGQARQIKAMVAGKLTGTKTLIFREQPYQLTIRTRLSETPDPAALHAELRRNKPAAHSLDYLASDERDWAEVAETWPTWADVAASCATWADVNIP